MYIKTNHMKLINEEILVMIDGVKNILMIYEDVHVSIIICPMHAVEKDEGLKIVRDVGTGVGVGASVGDSTGDIHVDWKNEESKHRGSKHEESHTNEENIDTRLDLERKNSFNKGNIKKYMEVGLEESLETDLMEDGNFIENTAKLMGKLDRRRMKKKRTLTMKTLISPCNCKTKVKRNGNLCKHAHTSGNVKEKLLNVDREEDSYSHSKDIIRCSNRRLKDKIKGLEKISHRDDTNLVCKALEEEGGMIICSNPVLFRSSKMIKGRASQTILLCRTVCSVLFMVKMTLLGVLGGDFNEVRSMVEMLGSMLSHYNEVTCIEKGCLSPEKKGYSREVCPFRYIEKRVMALDAIAKVNDYDCVALEDRKDCIMQIQNVEDKKINDIKHKSCLERWA
ncbi:hypothetical protein L2E82_50483 [Cichorium intybus]|nr:hypothetical protein L2E82_50483 [Cichorium intybus]